MYACEEPFSRDGNDWCVSFGGGDPLAFNRQGSGGLNAPQWHRTSLSSEEFSGPKCEQHLCGETIIRKQPVFGPSNSIFQLQLKTFSPIIVGLFLPRHIAFC